jgi:Large-conductance mechanosensitive channel, MscL
MVMLKGFKNFLMRGDVIVVAVGLSVALAFSNLVKAFTDAIINPLIAAAQGGVKGPGLGWQLVSGGGDGTYLAPSRGGRLPERRSAVPVCASTPRCCRPPTFGQGSRHPRR